MKKEDWIAKTRREKITAAHTRWRSVGRLLLPLFEDDALWALIENNQKRAHTQWREGGRVTQREII